jgi:hypothetical protein
MANIPAGFRGAISPKLKMCVSQDCSSAILSDITGLQDAATPYGWNLSLDTPNPRKLSAFNGITAIIADSSGNTLNTIKLYVATGGVVSVNYFPDTFTNDMELVSIPWNRPDGIYTVTYRFSYSTEFDGYNPGNTLGLAGQDVVVTFNQVISCAARNSVKNLWLAYLNDCCSANKDKALEAEALLYAIDAAAACADEFNASRIQEALAKIIELDSSKCNVCQTSKCKC